MKRISLLLIYTLLLGVPGAVLATELTNSDSILVQEATVAPEASNYTKIDADSAYVRENYAESIKIYEELLKKGVSAEIYYNLGNSYYKSGNIAKAILNYERAVLFAPNNNDYKVNLEIASAKKIDKDEEVSDIFLNSWGRAIVNLMNSNQWAIFTIVFFLVFLVGLAGFILSKNSPIKRFSFVLAIGGLIVFPISNYCSGVQKDKILQQDAAIVMEPSVTVRSTPSETGTSLFVIHQGKKVKIKDNTMKAWVEIQLENGQVGWMKSSDLEII